MHYPLLAVKRLSLPELAEAHRIPEQTDCPKIKHHLNICLVCIRFSNQSEVFFLSDGSDNLEYWNIDLRISSFQMESHRHARGEELGVLWHCQHLDLPSPQWHVMALDIIMSQQGWIQNAGEKSSDPTHTGHVETTGKMFHFHWVCAGISVLWWTCCCFLVALLRPEAAQLCPFASTSQGRCNSRKLLLTQLPTAAQRHF